MPIQLGNTNITKAYLGSTEVTKAYLGNVLVFGGVVQPLLLDLYPNASGAYSLRYLSSAYSGAVVRVRRQGDNLEQDFTPTEITDGTLTTFTGANNGYVSIWYDQSGNLNDATNAITTEQAIIVSSGILVINNGKTAVEFGTGGKSYDSSTVIDTSVLSMITISNNTSIVSGNRPFGIQQLVVGSSKDAFWQDSDNTLNKA